MVVHCDLLVDSVLHQRVHDCAVHLTEEAAGLRRVLRQDDEPVVVQDVAVQFVASTRLLANATRSALE